MNDNVSLAEAVIMYPQRAMHPLGRAMGGGGGAGCCCWRTSPAAPWTGRRDPLPPHTRGGSFPMRHPLLERAGSWWSGSHGPCRGGWWWRVVGSGGSCTGNLVQPRAALPPAPPSLHSPAPPPAQAKVGRSAPDEFQLPQGEAEAGAGSRRGRGGGGTRMDPTQSATRYPPTTTSRGHAVCTLHDKQAMCNPIN